MTSASCEMDSGAALLASAISAFRSIRYWSSGAMLGYGALASCACACLTAASMATRASLVSAIVLQVFRFIDFSGDTVILLVVRSRRDGAATLEVGGAGRSEEHTSELQSLRHLVC